MTCYAVVVGYQHIFILNFYLLQSGSDMIFVTDGLKLRM